MSLNFTHPLLANKSLSSLNFNSLNLNNKFNIVKFGFQAINKRSTQMNKAQTSENKAACKRKKFTPEEDEILRDLVGKMGPKKWDEIALQIPGRSGRQCRDRYNNYLVPGFFNGQWSPEEDRLLSERVREIGSQWSKIATFFVNRSANALKNRWNYFVSKEINVSVHDKENMLIDRKGSDVNTINDLLLESERSSERFHEPCDENHNLDHLNESNDIMELNKIFIKGENTQSNEDNAECIMIEGRNTNFIRDIEKNMIEENEEMNFDFPYIFEQSVMDYNEFYFANIGF
ncbi:Myb-like DNA-binding domain containing protein [Tritrichomonas foetus]|uniref:Myb-like DNA-binding domain containing protein n=1 Tax=Tritrichomonas foetus TaxID=1144522 RepID=A0A1J4KNZ4_9EUKA|nr:Myb-like DNA-binding domain containing protein [Tritrichomonas foetus]|eukprot:OHT12834.1 Myb-like DNA-binding domain containing protein [Tritrichomonas foetus]